LVRELISSFSAPEGMVSSASATQAASEAASAGWDAANAAAIAEHDATADLLGMELACVEASATGAATQLMHERERTLSLGEDLKAAQVRPPAQHCRATLRVLGPVHSSRGPVPCRGPR
jgi:hypothetical protein